MQLSFRLWLPAWLGGSGAAASAHPGHDAADWWASLEHGAEVLAGGGFAACAVGVGVVVALGVGLVQMRARARRRNQRPTTRT